MFLSRKPRGSGRHEAARRGYPVRPRKVFQSHGAAVHPRGMGPHKGGLIGPSQRPRYSTVFNGTCFDLSIAKSIKIVYLNSSNYVQSNLFIPALSAAVSD